MNTPTPRQQKLINGLIANATDQKETKPLKKVLVDAGYSEKSAHNPNLLINSPTVLAETQKVIKQMERARTKALVNMDNKVSRAPYNHLVDGVDKMTKNIQLLSGKATDNTSVNIQISEQIAQKNT